jgi:hypothetical protein
VAASDLGSQAAGLWLIEDGELAGFEPLPLAHVDGVAAFAERLIITGWSRTGERRLLVGHVAGSAEEPIELPVRGDVAREPRPIVTAAGVLIVWDEYAGDGIGTVVQAVQPANASGWRLDGEPVRRRPHPFADAADVAPSGDGLVVARVDEASIATIERLDARLVVRSSATLAGDRSGIAVATGDRVVVASGGRDGTVAVQCFDDRLARIGDPVTVQTGDRRASVGALAIAAAADAPLAIVTQVETVLGDPETVGFGAEATLGPLPRRTMERCYAIDLDSARVSDPLRLDPPSRGASVIVWHGDRVHVVHGSSPLSVTELAITHR